MDRNGRRLHSLHEREFPVLSLDFRLPAVYIGYMIPRLDRQKSLLLLCFAIISTVLVTMAGAQEAGEVTGTRVLSILDFTDNSGSQDYAWLSAGLSDMLVTDLAAADITLVDRDDLNEALAEQSLALAGITDDSALEIGRMVMADAILNGAFAISGNLLRIDARIADVNTGEVITSAAVTGSPDTIFALEAQLAVEICLAMNLEPPPGLGEPGTISLPAARAYYEGIVLQSSGDVTAAKQRFEDAARLDPLYAKPRYSLEESWQLLKDFRALRQQREVNALWKKAEALKARLAADPFITDTDVIMAAYTAGSPTVQIGTPPADDPTLGSCPTPAVCLWNLQMTYWEIGNSSSEYFDETATENATLREIVQLADRADEAWPDDEWLPEILYWKVMAQRWLGEWEEVLAGCERLFIEWPDFRMAWALEDMYETALEEIGG